MCLSELLEADALGILLEALPAHVQTVFPDQAVGIAAHSADTGSRSVLSGVGVPDIVVTHTDYLVLTDDWEY